MIKKLVKKVREPAHTRNKFMCRDSVDVCRNNTFPTVSVYDNNF